MKASSMRCLTTTLVAALLAGSGICVALRNTVDERRASRTSPPSPERPDMPCDRTGATAGTVRTRLGDPAAFHQRLTRLLTSGDPLIRSRNLLEMIDGLDPADFPVFVAEMKKVCGKGNPALLLALSAWAEADPAAALEQELGDGSFSGSTVLKIWMERDPAGALGWLVENGKPADLLDQALATLAATDPPAALAWAKNHDGMTGSPDMSHGRLAAVLQAMLPGRPGDVIREFWQLPAGIRQSLLAPLGARMGSLPGTERLLWLESFPPGGEREAAAAAMIPEMKNLEERLALLADYPAALNREGAGELYGQWVVKDREAALGSLEKLPPGPLLNAAVDSAVQGFSRLNDPQGALDLMNRHPGAVTQWMLMGWIDFPVHNRGEWKLAISTIARVGDDSARESLYHRVLASWLDSSDRKAARAWLDTSEDAPQSLREAFEHR